MSRRKPNSSQLAPVNRNGEANSRPMTKRRLDFGERWSYAPALEANSYIKLRNRYQLFINGRFVSPKSGQYFDSINPATEEKLAEIGSANKGDVDLAVKAARRSYKNVWSKMPGRERGKYLFRIARLLQEKARELAVLETMCVGNHPEIDKVGATGSTEVGKRIASVAVGTKKKLTLELGGKAANIIFDDAAIDQAVEGIIAGIYFNQGHFCCAGSRLFVQESIFPNVIRKLRDRISTLRVGDPLDKNTDIGAINSRAQLDKICELVDSGLKQGAQLVQSRARLPAKGYWYPPSFFTGVTASHRIAQEEIFGPVLSVMTFRTPDDAIARANNTPYGLSAGVWTDKGSKIFKIVNQLRAGVVWANTYNKFDPASPFGGYKESGFGREGGRHGLLPYLTLS